MTLTPTPTSAALAGVFSAIVWPLLWSRFGGTASAGSLELILATLAVIALPAHAFVVGFGRGGSAVGTIDRALLKRVGAWFAAAAVTALVMGALRG